MSNIVDAYPREGVVFRTKPLFQWDWGQIVRLHISDLPASYKVEFSNSTRADAVPTVQTTDEVTIPAQFLESGNPVYAWIVVVDEARTTEYSLIIPVSARSKPTDAEPSPEEQSEIEQTLAALNGAVADVQEIADAIPDTINDALAIAKASGEFDGQDGISPTVTITEITGGHRITIIDEAHPNGQVVDVLDGENGDVGRGIVSVQKTGTAGLVDTYTITYTDSATSTFTVTNGKNGNDGVSPSITVTDITGGHRVTITDADGQHSFDVLDGEDGQGIPTGGTAGQVLEKTSGADYAVSWADKNPVVQVSGTTPSITALPGVRYVCGEVATLDITLPASGIVDVVFESGSTPTVLTITPSTGQTVRWANGFDPTALDADTTYEINIMDGLGVAGAWS